MKAVEVWKYERNEIVCAGWRVWKYFQERKIFRTRLDVVMEENYRKFIGKEKGVIAKQPFGGRVWGGCGADSNVPAGIWKNTWYMAGS
jgi:hypothetical protein